MNRAVDILAQLKELVGDIDINHPVFASDEQRAEVDALLDELEALPTPPSSTEDEFRTSPGSCVRRSYRVLDYDTTQLEAPEEAPQRRRSRIPMIDPATTPLETLRACVADVAESLGWPCIVAAGRSFAGESGYGPLIRNGPRPDLLSAIRQLEAIETRVIAREDWDRQERAREALREEPDPMFDQVLEILADAQEQARVAGSVEGRLERIEKSVRELTERLAR